MKTDADLRLLRILWAALVMSVLIYGVVVMMLARTWDAPARSLEELKNDRVLIILALVAVTTLSTAYILPGILERQGNDPTSVRKRSVMQWALIESVAVFGLVGAFLKQDPRVFMVFAAVSFVGFLLTFPRQA